MAYNPYFPMSYQQQVFPQYVQPQQQTSIIWVSGEREASFYPVAPNNAVTLWSQSEPVVYVKKADATGKPTMTAYELVECSQSASEPVQAQDGKMPSYATKDELSAVIGAVKGFDAAMSTIRSDIDSIKGDLYGLAGKKKPVKKEEPDE